MITVYQYPKCSTCRKALAWLDARKLAYRKVDLVQQPPSAAILAAAAKTAGLPVTKLFNTSGESYRAGDFKTRAARMSDAEVLAALAADGKLIKRPLLVGDGVALIGFREDAWAAALT